MKRLSELHEHELIRLVDQQEQEVKKEWENRWGLPFPMIRLATGIIKYGEGMNND